MRKRIMSILAASGLVALALAGIPSAGNAASHREAPLISQDPTADITDFFMFRSYEPGMDDKVVLIMDVIPGEEPSSGPNYYNFDPNVTYRFRIDNDQSVDRGLDQASQVGLLLAQLFFESNPVGNVAGRGEDSPHAAIGILKYRGVE